MPQPFNNAIITNNGAMLLNKAQAGEADIQFTRMAVGDGIYTDDEKAIEELRKKITLKSFRNSFPIAEYKAHGEYSVRSTAIISNLDSVTQEAIVTESYYINEIGLYAKEKDGGDDTEILYSIAVTAGEHGDYMPAYNGSNPSQIIQDYYVTVNNSESVSIKTAGAALLKDGGDSANVITEFESNDVETVGAWTNMPVITGGDTHRGLFSKLSTAVKNIRYLYKVLGSEDISQMGDGTVTGIVAALKQAAFLNPTNNLLATIAGTSLDAVQGSVLKNGQDDLQEQITQINSDLSSRNNIKSVAIWIEKFTGTDTNPYYDYETNKALLDYPAQIAQRVSRTGADVLAVTKIGENILRIYFKTDALPTFVSLMYKV